MRVIVSSALLLLVFGVPAAGELLAFKARPGASAAMGPRLAALGLPDGVRPAFLPVPPGAVDRVGLARTFVLELPAGQADVGGRLLSRQAWVEWAEPLRGVARVAGGLVPDDSFFGNQWQLDQPSDIDMDVPEAWELRGGLFADGDLVVAQLDTGLEFAGAGPDLLGVEWQNPDEIANGLDDDGNGLVDDVFGYDFVDDDATPDAVHVHGMEVAGIFAARSDNANQVAGIASGVKVMVLKNFGSDGTSPTTGPWSGSLGLAVSLQYATDKGAHIINNSWGSDEFSQLLADAVQYALDNGVHVVFAAGNDGLTTGFPAELPGVIGVAAIDSAGQRSIWSNGDSSNYGPWVDVCAGGSGIWTVFQGGITQGNFTGTSAACPQVVGVAALLLSEDRDLAPAELRTLLMKTAKSVDALNPGYEGQLGAGHVNALAALQWLDAVEDLGGGLAGASQPVLNGFGAVSPGGELDLGVSRGLPFASGALFLGLSQADLAFKGGVLVPAPDLIVPIGLDTDGAWLLEAALPIGLVPGTNLVLQVALLDAGAPVGVALSNAVRATLTPAH